MGNNLQSLPPALASLEALQTLELGGNPLGTLPPDVIANGIPAIRAHLRSGQAAASVSGWGWLVSLLSVAALAGIAAGGWYWWMLGRAEREEMRRAKAPTQRIPPVTRIEW